MSATTYSSSSKAASEVLCTDLIVILGPTAVGKTDLSISLARRLGCDIVNADSRQLFAPLKIGTAAPTAEQLSLARHHFVGTLSSLDTYYSAALFERDVLDCLSAVGGPAILSGGSMMYIDAVCEGIDDIPTISDELRESLKRRYDSEGIDRMAAELRMLDPDYYAICDLKNHKRIIHALEICLQSGQTYTSLRRRDTTSRPFRIHKIGLERPREELFERINARVDKMMSQGLLDEVRSLVPWRHCNALNTVGYKELFAYLDGQMSLHDAVERIKKNTRVYAKKQMTWFKRDESIRWFQAGGLTAETLADTLKIG